MSAKSIFEEVCKKQGWNILSQKAVLHRYIETQNSLDAYNDYLAQAAYYEGVDADGLSPAELVVSMGWNEASLVFLDLQYIENQNDDERFSDYLDMCVQTENILTF